MSEPLTHVCPLCDAHGIDRHCICEGAGAITAAQAATWTEETSDPVRELAPVPKRMAKPCDDCAFRRGSPERDGAEWPAIVESVAEGEPFFCHVGMLVDSGGRHVPPAGFDDEGRPIGAPVCAGWARARRRLAAGTPLRRAVRPVGSFPCRIEEAS